MYEMSVHCFWLPNISNSRFLENSKNCLATLNEPLGGTYNFAYFLGSRWGTAWRYEPDR